MDIVVEEEHFKDVLVARLLRREVCGRKVMDIIIRFWLVRGHLGNDHINSAIQQCEMSYN